MKSLLYFFYAIFVLAVLSANALPQEKSKLKPLADNASLAETQKWLTQAVSKAASYRRGRSSVSVSGVRFDGCTLSFRTAKQSDSSVTETMGTTKTVTSVKNDLSIDLSQIPPEGVFLTDNLYPTLMNLVFSLNKPQPVNPANGDSGLVAGKVAEIVVKQEDAELLKDGFSIAVRHCETGRKP